MELVGGYGWNAGASMGDDCLLVKIEFFSLVCWRPTSLGDDGFWQRRGLKNVVIFF